MTQEKTADESRSDAAEASQADSDWDISSGRSGMAKETKIGLGLCVLLVGAFAFVVFSKMNRQKHGPDAGDEVVAGTDESSDSGQDASDTSLKPDSDGSDLGGQSGDHGGNAFTGKQQTAGDDGFGIPQGRRHPRQFAGSAQQTDPWVQQANRENPAQQNLNQSAQQADPFASTSPRQSTVQTAQSTPRRRLGNENEFGIDDDDHGAHGFHSAQQQRFDPADAGGTADPIEQQQSDDFARQAQAGDDFFDPQQLAGESSEDRHPDHHHGHGGQQVDHRQWQQQQQQEQQSDAVPFDPFADPEADAETQQTYAAARQADDHMHEAEFVGQQETADDPWQQAEVGAATAQSAPLGDVNESDDARFGKFDAEQIGASEIAQSQAGQTIDVSQSSAARLPGQTAWAQQSTADRAEAPVRQTATATQDLADEFDPFAPEEPLASEEQHEPRAFNRQRKFAEQRDVTEQREFGGEQRFAEQPASGDHQDVAGQSSRKDFSQAQTGFAQRLESGSGGGAAKRDGLADRPTVYEVASGDNFWSIARKQYGAGRYYKALAAYNRHRIPDPQKMRPGMKVLIPDTRILEARFPELLPRSASVNAAGGTAEWPGFFTSPQGEPHYRVGPEDTLTGIARSHLGRSSRWVQIYALNRDRIADPARLKIGTVLRLPADASQVQLVGGRREFR